MTRGVRRIRRLLVLAALAVPASALAAAALPESGATTSTGLLFAELIGSMIVILAGCEMFANGVEHVGEKAHLSHAAAGSLLAAVGTALPETMIPILAIVFGAAGSGHDIGIGAILGAPFMLSTLAFFLLGLTVTILWALGRRQWRMDVNIKSLAFELRWFIATIAFVLVVSIIGSRMLNIVAGVVVLLIYALYFRRQLGHEAEANEEYTDTFYLNKFLRLPINWPTIISQCVLGLVAITVGAHLFIGTIEALSGVLGISALVLSLIIAPIATELPEKYNSITWTIKRQDTLAMGNISGALVFQSTIPVAVGLWFTEWNLGTTELLNLVITIASAGLALLVIRAKGRLPAWPLLVGGLFYLVYLVRIFLYGAEHGS
ncbi:MAG TPA: sodium:calcium antiporter [Thermodesulfobacteriota bacterium]